MKQKLTYLIFALIVYSTVSFAQNCGAGYNEVSVIIKTDGHGEEINWSLRDFNNHIYAEVDEGTYDNNQRYTSTVCVPENTCISFYIEDHHGDGLESPGSYTIKINGAVVANGTGEFDERVHEFNCSETYTCNLALAITQDNDYTSLHNNSWYSFTPEETGYYTFSTCGTTSCDTKIWVYDHCDVHAFHETQEGVVIYNDDNCGQQSETQAVFNAGQTYLLRIGHGESCQDEPVVFHYQFGGYVYGCTDESACNYSPLANVDDGSCIEQGSPECPAGPDLIVLKSSMLSSIQTGTTNVASNSCLYAEQCVTGTGNRQLIKFTTHIQNIGDTDYYIGVPSPNNPQFDYNNCHGHAHYVGYAEYLLFSCDGVSQNIGQKNGFCVLDLECNNGGDGGYTCNNMGISAGCGDYYNSSLQCQWIDVTNVPNGKYIMVVRVNWDNSPDYLGRYETDLSNNWASVCLTINRTPSNVLQVSVNNTATCPQNIAAIILGRNAVCKNSTETYSVPLAANANYNWDVTGGTIVSGQGTNSIDVSWGNSNQGSVSIAQNFYQDTCSLQNSKEVELRDLPQITEANVFPTGCTASSGEIHLEATGVDMPFSYSWSNGANSQDINNLAPGTYTVTVTNLALCDQTSTFTVQEGNRPPRLADLGATTTCNSAALFWDGPVNGNYKVRYRYILNGAWTAWSSFIDVGTALNYTYTNLLPSTKYKFQVKYTCPGGTGSSNSPIVKLLPACFGEDENTDRNEEPEVKKVEVFTNMGIMLSPNPTADYVKINCVFTQSGTASLLIFNSTGGLVYEAKGIENNGKTEKIINVQQLPSGLYNIVLKQGAEIYTSKLSIQR
jgi:hypothetical protein